MTGAPEPGEKTGVKAGRRPAPIVGTGRKFKRSGVSQDASTRGLRRVLAERRNIGAGLAGRRFEPAHHLLALTGL
jgi:hypothetical protein